MHFITLYNPGFVKRGRSLMVSPLIAYWWVSSPSHARDKQRGQTAAESARVIRQVWTRRQTRSFILDSISLVLREFGLISGLLTAKREKQLWEERKMNERWAKHSESNPSQFTQSAPWSVQKWPRNWDSRLGSVKRFSGEWPSPGSEVQKQHVGVSRRLSHVCFLDLCLFTQLELNLKPDAVFKNEQKSTLIYFLLVIFRVIKVSYPLVFLQYHVQFSHHANVISLYVNYCNIS